MEEKKTTHFLIALAVQLSLVLVIIVFKVSVLTGGADVNLIIQPVDPRDPLRGDYVTFNLDISRIDQDLFYKRSVSRIPTPDQLEFKEGDMVYVVLRGAWDGDHVTPREYTHHEVKFVTDEKPESLDDIFIKGTITRLGTTESTIKYGIEEYFIPEGTGRNMPFGRTSSIAQVKIDDDGNAVLKGLLIDGQPWP